MANRIGDVILTQQGDRICCASIGHFNRTGKPKLLATRAPDGLWTWCPYCKESHFLKAAYYNQEMVKLQSEVVKLQSEIVKLQSSQGGAA